MPRIPFEKGNPGKPKGARNKNTILKDELALAFKRNTKKARVLLDGMFSNKVDFKWICELKASIEPKEMQGEGFGNTKIIIVRDGNQIKAVAGQVPIQQEPLSGAICGVGNGQDIVPNIAGNVIQRRNT